MPTRTEKNEDLILGYLYDVDKKSQGEITAVGKNLSEATELKPSQINEAIELLSACGLVERLQTLGTAPYHFYSVKITQRGKYEFRRRKTAKETMKTSDTSREPLISGFPEAVSVSLKAKPPAPIGSPYGFTDADWETAANRRADKNILYVVFGLKFHSKFYARSHLETNIRLMFEQVLDRFNKASAGANVSLTFIPLHAGYGEHLFNEIARDIICSDIAVFETSDMAPNVFIEIGVALTWGSQVFLIKKGDSPLPPSDISGQTYADYRDNGRVFVDIQHQEKLYRMVERAMRKKG